MRLGRLGRNLRWLAGSMLLLCASTAAAQSSTCGNGLLDPGEVCDASAPAPLGDAACPGSCVQCACSPSSNIGTYAIVTETSLKLGKNTHIVSGDVAVTDRAGREGCTTSTVGPEAAIITGVKSWIGS